MLYTFIFTGSHTIGNLVASEAMSTSSRVHSTTSTPDRMVAYRVPHSLNDKVHLTTEATSEAEAKAHLKKACERILGHLTTIMQTPAVQHKPTHLEVRINTLHTDSDIH
jgi:DNA-directed RNA polymerase subunit L